VKNSRGIPFFGVSGKCMFMDQEQILTLTKEFISMKTFNDKIPSVLPLLKGGKLPLFGNQQ